MNNDLDLQLQTVWGVEHGPFFFQAVFICG